MIITAKAHLYKLAIGVVDPRLGRVGMSHIEEVVVHLGAKVESNLLRGLPCLKYIHLICLEKIEETSLGKREQFSVWQSIHLSICLIRQICSDVHMVKH